MEWISVIERLPPYLTQCLVTNGKYVATAWSKDDDPGWCAMHPLDGQIYWYNDVTHWMPLPEPPSPNPKHK